MKLTNVLVLAGLTAFGSSAWAAELQAAADAAGGAAIEQPKSPPWEASATLGATFTSGNTKTLLISGAVGVSKKWKQDELDLGIDGVYGENNGTENAESIHGSAQYNRLFTERIFGFGRLEGLHDAIADVDYRLSLTAGGGYYLIKETNMLLRAEVGPGYVWESVAGVANDYAAIRFAERFEWKLNDRVKLYEMIEYLPQVDRFANYVVNAELGIESSMTKRMSTTIFLQDTYRSEPAPGKLHNDMKLVAGIKYKLL